jgi:hypothetical protein
MIEDNDKPAWSIMAETSLIPFYIVMAVLCIGMIWPDNDFKPPPTAPRKGFWQARDIPLAHPLAHQKGP